MYIKTYFVSEGQAIETIFFVLSVDGFGEFVTIGAFVFPGFVELFLFAILFTFFVFFTVTLQTYFFLPTFACTLAFPAFFPLIVTSVFFFLLSVTFFLPEATVHFTFFLLFCSLIFTVFPTFTVTVFLFSFTFFFAAKALCGSRDNAIAKISKRTSVFCFLIVKSSSFLVN